MQHEVHEYSTLIPFKLAYPILLILPLRLSLSVGSVWWKYYIQWRAMVHRFSTQ